MKKLLFLLIILIFVSGCNEEGAFDGYHITISIPDANEIEQFTGPIKDYNITTLTAEDFGKFALSSPKGFEFSVYARYTLKEYDNSTIDIRITKYGEKENITENINNIFNLFSNNAKNTGHRIEIVNEFNFIDQDVDTVRAFYHKGWFYEGCGNFFVMSSIFVKKGAYIIEVSEYLNPNIESIGQENLEKIVGVVLNQNNFL